MFNWDMFNRYPYINLTDRNLDMLTRVIREMQNELKNFVSLNAVKYANPLQWNITKSYEKNTVVITPDTGVAYISVEAVPAGVNITRTKYWTKVFDLSVFLEGGLSNFANNYESNFTYTATTPTDEGKWVVWNSKLYYALTNITIGDKYEPNINIKRFTVEGAIIALNDAIAVVAGNLATEVTNRENADTQIRLDLTDLITSRVGVVADNLATEVTNRENADTQIRLDLTDLITSRVGVVADNLATEVTNRENADNAINAKIGNLANLNTPNKTSVVNAINSILRTSLYFNVKDYGAVGDGNTNDSTAIQNAVTACRNNGGGIIYFPYTDNGYVIASTIALEDNMFVVGESLVKLISSAADVISCKGIIGGVEGITINATNVSGCGIHLKTANDTLVWQWRFNHLIIDGCVHAIYSDSTTRWVVDCIFNDIYILHTKGDSIVIPRSRGFMTFRNVKVDQTYNVSATPYTSFNFEDFIGIELEACDAVGPVSSLVTPTYNANQTGFKFIGSSDGKASIWLTRVLCDTSYGNGITIGNCNYVYGNYVESFGNLGTGITLQNCNDVSMSNVYSAQSQNAARAAGVSGITLNACTNVVLNNIISRNNSQTGLTVYACERCNITNALLYDNAVSGYAELSSNYNLLSNSSAYGNGSYNVSQNGVASALSNCIVGNSAVASAIGAYTS